MKVLLIGGTGHVGSRLAQHLHSNSIAVSIATRRPHSVHSWFPQVPAVEIADIEETNWQRIFPAFTHVFHLVSPQEHECNQFPDEAKRIVEKGSAKIGKAVRDAGCRLIYLSTTQVYGPQPTGRITVKSPTNPSNTYADVHLRAEEILHSICGSSATIARLANSVGLPVNPAHSTWQLLVHDLAREVTQQQTLTLRSSGLQHRSFIAMSEVVVVLEKILSADFNSSTINIANPDSMSVRSMAELVCQQYVLTSGRSAEVRLPEEKDLQFENPFQICCDVLIDAGVELGKIDNIKNEIVNIFTELRAQP